MICPPSRVADWAADASPRSRFHGGRRRHVPCARRRTVKYTSDRDVCLLTDVTNHVPAGWALFQVVLRWVSNASISLRPSCSARFLGVLPYRSVASRLAPRAMSSAAVKGPGSQRNQGPPAAGPLRERLRSWLSSTGFLLETGNINQWAAFWKRPAGGIRLEGVSAIGSGILTGSNHGGGQPERIAGGRPKILQTGRRAQPASLIGNCLARALYPAEP